VCTDLDNTAWAERIRWHKVRRGLLAAADVVGATCVGSGGSELQGQRFALVIMDEASQATE
jgi:superfamily I DNA and/or RNA helicase